MTFVPVLRVFPVCLSLDSGLAFFVALLPDRAIALNFEFQEVRKRVDDGNADAVQSAGNLVAVAIEFSAGVQHGEHNFRRGALFRGVHVHRNAAAIVHHGHGIVGVHRDVHFVREARHRFVDGVVHHFPHQVVQAHLAGRADVHRGTQAHGFEPAEHLDGLRVVLGGRLFPSPISFVAHFSPDVRCLRQSIVRTAARRTSGFPTAMLQNQFW